MDFIRIKFLILLLIASFPSISQPVQYNLCCYLEQAFQNDPELNSYTDRIRANHLDSSLIKATARPRLVFTGDAEYAPIVNGIGFDSAITNLGTASALFGVLYPAFRNIKLGTQLRALSVTYKNIVDSSIIAQQDLIKNITGLYISAYSDLLQWRISGKIVDLLEKEEMLLKDLTYKGFYLQTDYLKLLISFKQQQNALKKSLLQYRTDLALLNIACGFVDTSFVELLDPGLHPLPLPGIDSSVFFKHFITDSIRISIEKDLNKQGFGPIAIAKADAGLNSSFTPFSVKHTGFGGGMNLIIPIYDGGQKKLKNAQLSLEENTLRKEKTFFIKQYCLRIALLKEQLSQTEQLIIQSEERIRYQEALVDAGKKLLEKGDLKISDFVDAISGLLDAQSGNLANIISRYQLINELNYWSR